MIYKFNKPDSTHSQGYATVVISESQAIVDLTNTEQVALAKKLGGQPAKSIKKIKSSSSKTKELK